MRTLTPQDCKRMRRETGRAPGPNYTAKWQDTSEVIYSREPHGNLFGALPPGSWPESWGPVGEEWNGAVFTVHGTDRKIIITREDNP